MKTLVIILTAASFAILSANAQAARKEVKTSKGQSVILTRLVNTLSNCHMGPVPVPAVVEKPQHGLVQLAIVPTDIATRDRCAAHKADAITVIYSPAKEYVGTDNITIELVAGNQIVLVSYTVTVSASL